MPEATTQKLAVYSDSNLKKQIRLLDGRIKNISLDQPFSINGDTDTHLWDLSWLISSDSWPNLLLNSLLQLLRTHSLPYAYQVARMSKALLNRPVFLERNQLDLEAIAKAPELWEVIEIIKQSLLQWSLPLKTGPSFT